MLVKIVMNKSKLPYVQIYTDGACQVSKRNGGYAAILVYKNKVLKEVVGNDVNTTNNKMELMAVIAALRLFERKSWRMDINTDSKYVIKGITEWISRWVSGGWLTAKGESVKNKELWQELYLLIQRHKIDWIHVLGHSGDYYNERCDKLAKEVINQ